MLKTIHNTPQKIKDTIAEFPPKFWTLVGASFVDQVGQKMVFPFFALYITKKFGVGMTEAGVLLGLFTVSSLVGGLLGGALADRFGRKVMVLFGLVVSALSALAMGFVEQLHIFYVLAVLVGLLSDIAGPAWQAMVADLVPEKKRTEGFGVMRVSGNLAWMVGPVLGGILAGYSYLLLFIIDAVASIITALLIFWLIPETKPESAPGQEAEGSMLSSFAGYAKVFSNGIFIAFIAASMLMVFVYLQMYGSLSVYLRDVHGISERGYSWVLFTSAIIVVLFQFWVSRVSKKYPPMLVMAAGAVLYMVGFSAYGFVTTFPLFLLAMVVITFGEMLVVPVGSALAAFFAPEDMRGRYMAVFGLSWAIPGTIGPVAAGLVMDNLNPNLVWYAGGVLCFVSALSLILLHRLTGDRFTSLQSEQTAAPAD